MANSLKLKPVKAYDITANNLYYIANKREDDGEIIIYNDKYGELKEIKRITYHLFGIFTTPEEIARTIEITLINSFEEYKCTLCKDMRSALLHTNTKIGNVCINCYSKMANAPGWEELENLEAKTKK